MPVGAGTAEPMLPARYRVTDRKQETADSVTLELEPVDAALAAFRPGQFNMVWAFGVGEVPISISSAPGTPLHHTIRSVGSVTRALCDAGRGDVVGLRGPFGTHWDLEKAAAKDIVIVAGGIGLAPLRPAITSILETRERFGHVVILTGARSPDEILFAPELERWRSRFDLDVDVTVDYASPSWLSHVGVVTKLIPRAPFDPKNTAALVCGPEVMMRFAATALVDRGVAFSAIQVSMERNMQCAIGHCGHCQLAGSFVCRDGPVFSYERVAPWLRVWER
jgi:NAD(P)H-flavin reductase